MHMIEANLARQIARRSGMFAMLLPPGTRLVFYRGDQTQPRDTWEMAGSTLADYSAGYVRVSRHAVEAICTDAKPGA